MTKIKKTRRHFKPGSYVKLSFEDRGSGISPEDLPNIFDPYFTTKPGSSGLGLATSHTIIQRHGGHISVNSQAGIGTTFSLYLPAPSPVSDQDPPLPQQTPKAQGRVLVMDDEVSIRNMVRDALTQIGYDVLGVQDGSEAISSIFPCQRHGATICCSAC